MAACLGVLRKVGTGDHHSGGEVKSVQLYFLNGFLYMQWKRGPETGLCQYYNEVVSPHSFLPSLAPSCRLFVNSSFFLSGIGRLPSFFPPMPVNLFLVLQLKAAFLLFESRIFLFITFWWFFKCYDWHFEIWVELISYILFLSTFLTA